MKIEIKITQQQNADYFKCSIGNLVSVEFEEYIAAVVGSEIGKQSLEACKAQAIAARTYAIYHGVLDGKPISDSSATAQAYKASRADFEVCKLVAKETAGIIITYADKPINAVYSNSNGGRTVSAKTKWGSAKVYLPEQYDPWDSATGHEKDGHGVGLSQCGTIWAANHGASYVDILQFYYPKTKLMAKYGAEELDETRELLLRLKKTITQIKEEL